MECIVLDIRNHFELRPNLITEGECVVFQGSIQLFKKLKSELKVFPLGWMTDDNYLCSNYYPHVQKFLFNDFHVFSTLTNLKHNKWWFYSTFGKDALIYVRPNCGNKTFTGQLIDLQDFDEFFDGEGSKKLSKRYGGCEVKNTDMLIISTPKNIIGEWRYIVTDKKEILGCSSYMYHGNRTYVPNAPPKATKLVNEILENGWYPDPVFTVDIVQDGDGNFWLMEFNSFTSAIAFASALEWRSPKTLSTSERTFTAASSSRIRPDSSEEIVSKSWMSRSRRLVLRSTIFRNRSATSGLFRAPSSNVST